MVDSPTHESLLETIRSRVATQVGSQLLAEARRLRVVSFPNKLFAAQDLFVGGYAIEKVFLVSGQTPAQFTPWEQSDIIFNWQDLTFNPIDPTSYIETSYIEATGKSGLTSRNVCTVNFSCNDIRKRKIARLHDEVLGYPLDVDPLTYLGKAVCKSDMNATHDGRIVDCPIEPQRLRNDKVYSVLIDNAEDGYAIDFRVVFIKGLLDFFYEKRRPIETRFSNTNSSVSKRRLREEFSDDEITKISSFCRTLGADYGELDILRDRVSGKIYAIDFAKTPAGPPNGLPKASAVDAIEQMSVAYLKNIVGPFLSACIATG
jgi:hypothetical protein